MEKTKTKGLRFIGRNKAVIDIAKHRDIMEDAIDRIKVKEAMQTGEFIAWDELKQKLDKKHRLHDLSGSTSKKSRKVSRKGS